MKRTALSAWFCAVIALLLCACGSREESVVPDMALVDAIEIIRETGKAGATTDELTLLAAEKSIGLALGDEWSDATGSGWQSIGILNHDRGILLFQREEELPQNVRLSLLDREYVPLWKVKLELGANFILLGGKLVEEPGLEDRLVKLTTANDNAVATAPTVLYYAIGDDTCRLVWAEDKDGEWRADKVGEFHPNLVVAEGKLNSTDLVDQLTALVALSQPAFREQRADTRVRSILTTLAKGTANNRLAEAAAKILTLPR